MALMRVYCGLAASEPTGTTAGNGWLTIAIVDDAGRLLDVCDVGDDAVGFVELGALLAERSGGSVNVAVAADSDEHHVTLLLAAAGRPMAIVDEELLSDYADRFGDDSSADELSAERQAVGLARALAAGALTAAGQSAPRELMALKPVLSAHAAMAAGRHGTAVALREVLRELYPAALRAYPDPAEPVPLAILDALPEPGLLGSSVSGRGRDAAVAAQLASDGIADPATIADALTALRVAIAETPRRTGIGKGTTTAVAETIREAVAAVRACDRAIGALIGLLSDKGSAVASGRLTPLAAETSRQTARRRPAAPAVRETEAPTDPLHAPAARAATIRPVTRPAAGVPKPVVPVAPAPSVATAAAAAPLAQRVPAAPAAVQSTAMAGAGATGATVPPPPPGITPMHPVTVPNPARSNGQVPMSASQPQPAAPKPPMQMPVAPSWALEPISGYDDVSYDSASVPPAQTPAASIPSAGSRPQYTPEPGPHAGYGFDSGNEPVAYPLDPQFPAPGSRETWPLNPPSYDEDAVRARSAVAFSYQQAPAQNEQAIPRQRDARIAPPWQAGEIDLPAEPPALRLIGRDGQRGPDREPVVTPALRLVGADEGRPPAESDLPYASPMNGDSDGDLLIFAQAARSAWFEWPDEEEPERPAWTDIDAGWSVAAKVEHPEVGGQTEVGLPRRVPQANLVPGSPLPPMVDQGLRIVRDPASMAAHTTGYFRGSRRGEEVRGYAVGGRAGRESGGGWDFSRDGWDSDRDSGYRSAVHR